MNLKTELDVERIRMDFPILSREVRGRTLIYLDNAATSQKPLHVIRAQSRVYEELNANVHRGIHFLSQASTDAYEKSRQKVARFLGLSKDDEIIFTRGTTEAINLVAHSYGQKYLHQGDTVLVTRMEHHANFVPWQVLAQSKSANFKIFEMENNFEFDLHKLEKVFSENQVKIFAFTAMSNVLGIINPVKKMAEIAKKYGAVVVVDAAQAAAHLPWKINELGPIDFYCFSAHKMCGPTGIGILWGRRALLEQMDPYQTGGNMILQVGDQKTTWNELPSKFEAGTPNYGDSIAFGAALDYLQYFGMESIKRYDQELAVSCVARLREIKGIKVLAPENLDNLGSTISFVADRVHPHDMATFLDAKGIAIRAGHHCAQPLMRFLKVPATNRASFYFYNTRQEVDVFAKAVEEALEYFG